MTQKAIHIHEAYNLSLKNHEIIHEKENLSDIEKTLHMSRESILVEDFNLHHFTWEESFYSRQHLLLNELIKMIINIDASLALFQDTIMRNYQEFQMTIDLIFTTDDIMNRLIWCKINEKMKNFSDHLLIQTIIDFRVCKKSVRKSRCNWKTMNEEKFINTLKEQMLKSLLNHETKCQCINEYIKQLLNALKKIIKIFTFWARSHEMIKVEWTKKCTEIIKSVQWMRRSCWIINDWTKYIWACDKKSKIIRKQKCSEYWKIMQNVEQFSRELFKTAKWARNAVANTLTQATIFSLIKSECSDIITTMQNKAKMMFQTHFSLSSKIFMLNTINFEYLLLIEDDVSLIHHEIKRVIYKATSDKILKHTKYINKIMHRLVDNTSEQIHSLFERCLQKRIQSTQFKSVITIMMQKSSKKDYFNAKIYKLIVLFNTLSKILKFIVFKRLQNVIKACDLILNIQMRACKHRSINTTLQLITEKIYTMWSNIRRKVVSLLSLNEKSAFDNVIHSKLLHDMKKKKVSRLLLKFVKNFLRNQRITITINDYMTMKCSVNVDILQDSLLSLILYLFYNANLLEACDNIKLRTSFINFVNDINILTYEEFIKRNCRVLSKIYDRCKQWSKMYDIKFLMTKHELIHFTRISKWFNMKVDVELMKHQIDSKSDIRVLRVQLNFKLKWVTHMHHIEAKLVIRQKIMQTIIESTWDSSMTMSKQIYFAMTCSLLSHEVII